VSVRALFPTLVYSASLGRGAAALNARLLREALQLQHDDIAGRRWSRDNYRGGYTSYGSLCRLQTISPTFARLERALQPHLQHFTKALQFDLRGKKLAMTDCWVNLMPRAVHHSWHLHPLSTISGTYYVQTPPGSAALKFEDPRLERLMAAPPRKASCRPEMRSWVSVPAQAGKLVLFESWLRHEVPSQSTRGLRVSISFNYGWF
jgi:uncharacterized protein (TIGR02466 family)